MENNLTTQQLHTSLKQYVQQAVQSVFNAEIEADTVQIQTTRTDFEGQLTVLIFPMIRVLKQKPEVAADKIGAYLQSETDLVANYNVVKGFLNLDLSDAIWTDLLQASNTTDFGFSASNNQTIMVEYSSPNTNKPLHLGHIRNNFLGHSISRILTAAGNKVIKTQIVNDRGIHICKSMLSWQKFGNGATPSSENVKGDHFVGQYYVQWDQAYKAQVADLTEQGKTKEEAEQQAPIMLETREMLRKWESGDEETLALWQQMNNWVYEGFEETYNKLGVDFDQLYYESDTYKLGIQYVESGLEKGVFYKKDDGSVWCDLEPFGLDQKLVLRSDGTALYMTQDIGTAIQRSEDFDINGVTYVVGNEQEYHFKVLFLILKQLGYDWADQCHHMSYGMVELPDGKMKSREGRVVDADDLVQEVKDAIRAKTLEVGKIDDFTAEEADELFNKLTLGALKYFILKVGAKKNMIYNPDESVDIQGDTGPFIQYTYARISSILKRANVQLTEVSQYNSMKAVEKQMVQLISSFPQVVQDAAKQQEPSLVANFAFNLAKTYNKFYNDTPILHAEAIEAQQFRISLSQVCAQCLANAFYLLGIEMPERM